MNFSRFILCFALLILGSGSLFGQVSGTKTIPTDYATIAAFITDINTNGIGSGGVTLNVPSGYTETAPAGGLTITATGTVANPIIIQGTGGAPKPIITASAALTAGILNDGIIKLVGSDYVTISGLDLRENAANTITAAATNNMTEFGVALFYTSVTDGCQNINLLDNTIALGATYQNAFGIYANSTHSASNMTTGATATTGNNNNLVIKRNIISTVNLGIVVIGPTAATDIASGLVIGGASGDGNTITFGLNGTFSGFNAVSGTVNGILVRNTKNANCSFNSLTSNGTVTSGNLNGIQFQAFSNTPTGTFSQVISNNSFNLLSAASGGNVVGITAPSGSASATSTMDISNNQFNGFGHSVASPSGTLTFISTASTHFTTSINNNSFNNLTVTTTGSVTFISHSFSIPTGGSSTASNNSIVTQFTKSGAGGTVTGFTTGASSPNGAFYTLSNNNFSNINLTGGTALTFINNTDGSGSACSKTVTGNTLSNVIGGTSAIIGFSTTYWGGASSTVGNNTFNNISGQGSITGINIGNTFAGTVNTFIQNNTLSSLASTGAGSTVTGITVSNTASSIVIDHNNINGLSSTAASLVNAIAVTGSTNTVVSFNKIYNLSTSNAGGSVYGINVTGGTIVNTYNNIIGDLTAPIASGADVIRGISINSTATSATYGVYYNSVHLTASSSGTNFGTSGIFHAGNATATTAALDMRNNIISNQSVSNGTGLTVAYRRSSTALNNYASTSNRNDLVAPVIFYDGTNSDLTLAAYQTRVASRDANSINVTPNFLSTVGGNAGFLHVNTALPTTLESAGVNISGITADYDGNIRQGNAGYTGTGTAPDIGADEFELAIVNCSAANGGTISPATATSCAGTTRTITATGSTNENGISYQWKVSTTAGGPYANVSSGNGATTTSYTTGALTAGTYYYVLEVTCSFGSIVGLSNEFALTVNPIPVVAVNPSGATYCSPSGTAAALTASGASTYAWSPATGLSATTGATVNASPSATTTYSVVGTALGCASAPTPVTVTVNSSPVLTSVTATPAAVCEGSNSQLAINANLPYNSGASAYTFAGTTGTYSAITGTTLGASAIGDDVGIGNLPVGFTFPYNGNTFTVFGARSNGLIELGQTSATLSGFSANSLSGNANCIAPLWDDNNTTGGSIIYATTGTAPNRVLTVQWTGMHVAGGGSSTNPTIDCQVRLHETTGVIEFIYGATSAALSSPTASIGISGATGNYLSVTPLTPANTSTVSSSTENSVTSDANFPSGTIYTFTPPAVPVLTYAWTPSTNLSATNIVNPVATGVTAPITYNVVATAASGCSISGNVSLTIKPLPTAPTGVNSAQCGTQIPTASVTSTTGVPTPTFVWYDAMVGGSMVQSSTSTTLTSNVSSTTTFGVAELSATGCESARTSVTVTVASADAISATTSSASICLGASINLNSANLNPTPFQNYTYSWSSTAGSGMPTPVSGAAQTVTPTALGTYTYTVNAVDGGCAQSESVTVVVNGYPIISSATATPATVCSNDPITLTGASIIANAGSATVGTQTTTEFGGGVYRYGYGTGDFRHQLVFTAAELSAAGIQAGNITAISFNVTSVGSGSSNNYTIKLGNTSASATTATFLTDPTTTVYNAATYTAIAGVNTHTFATPFNWNGTSNILIEICYNISSIGGSSTVAATTPSSIGNTNLLGTTNACTVATGTTYANRPLVTFAGQVGTNLASSLNWTWTPGTGLNTAIATTSISNTSGTPVSQVFTVTATNPTTGCAVTATTPAVTINPAAIAPTANNSTQCGTGVPMASVTGTGTPGNTFSWYLVATGGTAIAGETGSSLSGYSISATTTFYVSENNGTCSSARTPVTVTVTTPPSISIAGTTTICNGSSTSLTVSSSNDPNYTYTWSGGLGTGATVNASPTVATTYIVTATDLSGGANNGCVTTATTSITVNPVPQSFPITPATAVICAGSIQHLTSGGSVGGTAILGTGTTAPGTTSFPNPLSAYYGGTKHQMLFTAAELTAQGMIAGSKINSVAFDLNAFAGNACTNFTIRMGNTASTALTGFVTGTSTVYGPTTFTPSATGIVTFTLVTPYTWDGTSNIVVETVHNAGNGGNGSGTRTNTTTTATNTVFYGSSDNVAGGIAGFDALTSWGVSGASALRPNMRFVYTNIQPTWTPLSTLYTDAGATTAYTGTTLGGVYAKPLTTTTYVATYTGSNGCTAQSTATITVNNPTTSTNSATACDTYTWNGTVYNTSGTYTHTLVNSVGCDSIATLNLTINNSSVSSTPVTACNTYTWTNGTVYVTSGTYTQTLTNAAGCDSVATLVLTINHSTTATVNQTACQTYTWAQNGMTYFVSGMYNDTITNAAGCDSIITLNLTINQPTTGTDIQTACGSYTWNNTVYTTSGTYVQVLTSAAGCDSTVTLTLTINQPTTNTVSVTECTSYTWPQSGMTYATSGTYNDTIVNAAGCDSVVTLDLTIIQPTTSSVSATACTSYTWAQNGTTYNASGAYTDTIPNSTGCDSIITLNLTIVSFVATATDNGNATVTASTGTTYQWINCATNAPIAGATAQTFAATANGSYAAIVSNGTCSDTTNCVTIANVGIKENTISTISVHPNPTNDYVIVTMDASSATVEVMDVQGKLVQATQIKSGDQIDLSAYERGVYTLRIKTEFGTSVERIVKN